MSWLSDEAKHAYKWLQTWLVTALSLAPMAYEQLSAMQDVIPRGWFQVGMLILGIATITNTVRRKKKVRR